jgi:hypothetical protein
LPCPIPLLAAAGRALYESSLGAAEDAEDARATREERLGRRTRSEVLDEIGSVWVFTEAGARKSENDGIILTSGTMCRTLKKRAKYGNIDVETAI